MKIIAIEGADCTGKTTFCEFLRKNNYVLEARGDEAKMKKVEEGKVKYYMESGSRVEPDFWEKDNIKQAEFFLKEMSVAYKNALESGAEYLLCDRWYFSTLIYQSKNIADHMKIVGLSNGFALPNIDLLFIVGVGKGYKKILKQSSRKPRLDYQQWRTIKKKYAVIMTKDRVYRILEYTKVIRDRGMVDFVYKQNSYLA